MTCHHASQSVFGCGICELKALVAQYGAVGNGEDETATACPYCGLLVRILGRDDDNTGDGLAVYHELPECSQYLGEDLRSYLSKLRAQIRGEASA